QLGSKSYLVFFMGYYALISSWVKAGMMLYNGQWSFGGFISEFWTYLLSVGFIGAIIYLFFRAPIPNRLSNEGEKRLQENEHKDVT
ncbi:MAG: hypothetical protein SCK28_12080, partial [Bacillota bacterium]|nr:hypothetical protein [Bacillota bacterium]